MHEFSFVDSCMWSLSKCCVDPWRPPVYQELADKTSRSPHEFALLASSLRLSQEKRKMRTSKSSKSEILDNVPALCGVEKGIPTRYRGGIYETICVYARAYFPGRLNGLECVWPN